MSSPFSPHGDRTLFDLAHAALPAPAEELRRAAAQAVQDLDGHLGGHGYDLLGLLGCAQPSRVGSPPAGFRPRRTRS